jgi:hypothetical protein
VSENAEPPADAPSAPTTDGVTAPSGATADEATAPSGATADEATAPSGATADEATVLENSAPPADAPAQPSYGAHLGDDEPVGAIPFSPVNRPDSGTEAVPPAHANGASQPAGPVAELPPTRSTP